MDIYEGGLIELNFRRLLDLGEGMPSDYRTFKQRSVSFARV